jgi:hypothetical protein
MRATATIALFGFVFTNKGGEKMIEPQLVCPVCDQAVHGKRVDGESGWILETHNDPQESTPDKPAECPGSGTKVGGHYLAE